MRVSSASWNGLVWGLCTYSMPDIIFSYSSPSGTCARAFDLAISSAFFSLDAILTWGNLHVVRASQGTV